MSYVIKDFSKEIIRKLHEVSKDIMDDLGKQAAKEAKQNVHKISGHLEKSIKHIVSEDKKVIMLRVGAQMTKTHKPYYAHIVEHGSIKTKATPFLEPATQNLKRDFIARLRAEMDRLR